MTVQMPLPLSASLKKTEIAVVVPVYNSAASLPELVERLEASLESITTEYQIILVDDRGPQEVWPLIERFGVKNKRVIGIKLSRNFGQHPAISAGLELAHANWYVVMDCDLQDMPEDIPKLHAYAIEQKLDSVIAFRETHDVRKRRKLGSLAFNKSLEYLADIPMSSQIGNFRIFNYEMAQALTLYREKMRLFPALMGHLGFKIGKLDVQRPDRVEGKSNYSFSKLFKLAFDSIISNTIKPMYLLAGFGLAMSFLAFSLVGVLIFKYLVLGISVEGWASIMATVMLFGGIQIFVVSFVGIYVGKVFFEVKDRPNYIVAKTSNVEISSNSVYSHSLAR